MHTKKDVMARIKDLEEMIEDMNSGSHKITFEYSLYSPNILIWGFTFSYFKSLPFHQPRKAYEDRQGLSTKEAYQYLMGIIHGFRIGGL